MGWKIFFGFSFLLITAVLLSVYWFLPFGSTDFSLSGSGNENSNFTIGNSIQMQFYQNMRYPDSNISYKIYDSCNLKKKSDAQQAFDILQNATVLKFHGVSGNEEISVTCDDKVKTEGAFFIAGEGGPLNITKTKNFAVMTKGEVLLLKNSDCPRPNVAMHEILHALGFNHSQNPNNIMYPVTKCSQVLGEDIPDLISQLYSIPSYADLEIQNASAEMHGRYLDLNFTIRNQGLRDSGNAKIIIYADNQSVKEINLEPIKTGFGLTNHFGNLFVNQLGVGEIKIYIDSNFSELDKSNNVIKLEIKK